MKNSTIALLAVAGIGGYFILKQTQQAAAAVQGVAEIPLLPFKSAGQVFHGAEEQLTAGKDFIGQAAAQVLSNANTVVQIPQKQLEQTANNLLTALPAAVNALTVLNPLTLPLTAAAVTSNAIINAITPTNTPAPTANISSSSSSKSSSITKQQAVDLFAPSKVTNAGTTSVGYYNASTYTFTDTKGNKMSVAPASVKSNTATPFSTVTSNATSTATKTSTVPKTTSTNYFGTSSSSYFKF